MLTSHDGRKEEPMNRHYLMEHISRRLHTLVRFYTAAWEPVETFCARADLQDDHLGTVIANWFCSREASYNIPKNIPVFLSLNQQAVYARIPAGSGLFLLGPVSFSIPVEIRRQDTVPAFSSAFRALIPVCDFHEFMADVLLIANLFRSKCIDEEAILLENCINPQVRQDLEIRYMEHTFENQEIGKLHNPYDQEIREFSSIAKGDLEGLRNSLSEDYPGEVGTLARTPLRQMKNRGIVVVALASRAAMKGGILPEVAYSLSDSYIQKIEDCDDIPTILHLFHSAEYRYAQMVFDHNERKSSQKVTGPNGYAEKCKTYIFSRLHEKIHVREIAKELNINANYLSEIFHKHEGMTVTDYIHTQKIKLAQNLLVYSRYTYSEIASYLGYSSQSHLGRRFKQHTGVTMYQYRNKYGTGSF